MEKTNGFMKEFKAEIASASFLIGGMMLMVGALPMTVPISKLVLDKLFDCPIHLNNLKEVLLLSLILGLFLAIMTGIAFIVLCFLETMRKRREIQWLYQPTPLFSMHYCAYQMVGFFMIFLFTFGLKLFISRSKTVWFQLMNINPHLPIQWTSILIIGNRSYRNMGDELILLWTVKLLLAPLQKGGSDEGAGGSEQLGTSWRTSPTPPSEGGKEQRHITISCYDPKRLKQFFSQFIDTKQITFIHELPKGIRSAFKRLKKGWLKELKYFRKADTVILWWGEILTEENPSAYRYWLVGMRPFLLRMWRHNPSSASPSQASASLPLPWQGDKNKEYPIFSSPDRGKPEGRGLFLYLMWWIQIPTNKRRKKLFRFLLNKTTHLYLRDFQAVEEIKKFWFSNVDFFMDTSYFAYERWVPPFVKGGRGDFLNNNSIEAENASTSRTTNDDAPRKYIIVNLNKNWERFLPDIAKDIQTYLNKGYTIYYVPVAKWHNTYYNDLQYKDRLKEQVIKSSPTIGSPWEGGGRRTNEGEDGERTTEGGLREIKTTGGSNIQILDREENFEHFITILKGAELVISTRLHLFLIASFLHVPTKVYPYQRKILKMQEVIKKTATTNKG